MDVEQSSLELIQRYGSALRLTQATDRLSSVRRLHVAHRTRYQSNSLMS
jgi:hypothetical protein